MLKKIYSIKKQKKQLNSALISRNVDFKSILFISGVFKKNSKLGEEFNQRLIRSGIIHSPIEIFEKNYLVKVENFIYKFNSSEKFDLLIKSKAKLSICSIYHKNFIFNNRKILYDNNLFWVFIKVKLLSIILFK
jgi:hypothetical protein